MIETHGPDRGLAGLPALLSLLFGLLLAVPAAAIWGPANAEPQTLSELRKKLPRAKGRARFKALRSFAEDPRASLPDRLKALGQLGRELPGEDSRQIQVRLLSADLHGLAGRWGARRRELGRAAALHQKAGRTQAAEGLLELRQREALLPRMSKQARRASAEARSLRERETTQLEEARGLLASYQGDRHRHVQLLLRSWIARAASVDESLRAPSLVELDQWLLDCGDQRDFQAERREVLRLLALIARAEQRWQDAARHAVEADYMVVVPLRRRAFAPPSRPAYCRSPEVATLCRELREHGVLCGTVEAQTLPGHCFFDYSASHDLESFDPELAAVVLADYDALLQICLQEGAERGELLNTKVELEWTVGHDGRVPRHAVRPTRLRGSGFARCVGQAFGRFRYPRYRGELQHISLGFEVEE